MQFYFYTFLLLFFSAGAFADTNALAVPDSLQQQTDSLTKDTAKITDTTAATIQAPLANPRHQSTELWVFIACCLTFFIAGINRRINEKKHDQSILGFLKIGILGQSTERSFYEFNIHQMIGLAVHNLILALWAFYFLRGTDYQFSTNSLLFFSLLFFLISIIYLCKFFFQYLALNILQINDLPILLVKCTIGLGYFTTLISLLLFMVIYHIQYTEWHEALVTIFLILMSTYLVFRAFKYLQLFLQFFNGSIFYIILYFCGLELMPLLVFIKISLGIF
jgi:hypothetical protein